MSAIHVSASELVWLGQWLAMLRNPQLNTYDEYANTVGMFAAYAQRCGFNQTLNQVEPVKGDLMRCKDLRDFARISNHLVSAARGIEHALNSDATSTTVILTNVQPPPELLGLRGLKPYQQALHNDLVTCLQAHLNRPAIVMAWALGFDLIRSWVFDDTNGRLAAFNTQLANTKRSGEPAAIVDFEHFFHVGEYRFLQICRDSQDASLKEFDDKILRALQAMLDQRNEFAHANYSNANEHEANAYVVRMVRIVTSPPFV